MQISDTKIKVRYVETDQMGIAHHSNYYPWFEVARGDFIGKLGITYKQIEEQGVLFPLVESHCKYLVAAKYDDELLIRTKVKEMNGVKVIFTYEVIRLADHKTIAEGKTVHAFVTKDLKLINMKKRHPGIWTKLEKWKE